MSGSQKYRNIADNGRVAFVVDDVPSRDPWQVRFLEIRGTAEAVAPPAGSDAAGGPDGAIIRIHPKKIISFGVEKLGPPHETPSLSRTV
jgi:pyridoxamine 5'-phosphate oxidase family protein